MGKRKALELLRIYIRTTNGRGCKHVFMYRFLQHLSRRHLTYIPENIDISHKKARFLYIQEIPVITTIISESTYGTTV